MDQQAIAAALGKSPAWVTKYKQRGMPVHDAAAAREWCAGNLRAKAPATGRVNANPAKPPPRDPEVPPAEGLDAVGAEDYGKWRARREAMAAQQAEIDLAKMRGELVPAAAVRAEFAKALAAIRESLLTLPGRMAPVLAAESDARRVQTLLDTEIRASLGHAVVAK